MELLFVSNVATRLGVKPRQISALFYNGGLNGEACPVVSGRRVIPSSYIPAIAAALRERGLLPRDEATELATSVSGA